MARKCKKIKKKKKSPAATSEWLGEKQGVKANDVILKINNEETNKDSNKALEILQQKGLGTMLLTVERGKEEINIELTPDYVSSYYIGVNMKKHQIHFGIDV